MDNKDWVKSMLGGNGNGHSQSRTTDLKDLDKGIQNIDHMLDNLLLQLDGHETKIENTTMGEGLGAYINRNVLGRLLERLGGSYRINSALGQAIIESEGEGKMRFQVTALLADFIPLITLKVLLTSVRMDKFNPIIENTSLETQELMARTLKANREQLFQSSQEQIENFKSFTMNRLNGPRGF